MQALTRGLTREQKRAFLTVAHVLYRAVLIGNAPPATVDLRNRILRPRPGDTVIEVTTAGKLLDDRWADHPDTESWWEGQLVTFVREDHGPPRSEPHWRRVVTAHVCVTPEGNSVRWTNAELAAVPTDMMAWKA